MNSTRFINFNDQARSRKSLAASFNGRLLIVLSLVCVCLAWSPFLHAQCDQVCDSDGNTFLGSEAGVSTTSGSHNTGVGDQALLLNTLGRENTATGYFALLHNTTGSGNTAAGASALIENTIGSDNTAIGINASGVNTTGSRNVALGWGALGRNKRGSNNIAIGRLAGLVIRDGSWNIHIGSKGQGLEERDEEQTIRIGDSQMATYIAASAEQQWLVARRSL